MSKTDVTLQNKKGQEMVSVKDSLLMMQKSILNNLYDVKRQLEDMREMGNGWGGERWGGEARSRVFRWSISTLITVAILELTHANQLQPGKSAFISSYARLKD